MCRIPESEIDEALAEIEMEEAKEKESNESEESEEEKKEVVTA